MILFTRCCSDDFSTSHARRTAVFLGRFCCQTDRDRYKPQTALLTSTEHHLKTHSFFSNMRLILDSTSGHGPQAAFFQHYFKLNEGLNDSRCQVGPKNSCSIPVARATIFRPYLLLFWSILVLIQFEWVLKQPNLWQKNVVVSPNGCRHKFL